MALPLVQDKIRELCGEGTTSMQEVIDRLTVICQKPIKLKELHGSWGAVTGFYLNLPDHFRVVVPLQDSTQYKHHCIYHELGHIYLESLKIPSVAPDFSEEMLQEIAGAKSMGVCALPHDPVERWVEEFAFEMSKKTRASTSSDPDRFLC
uniref:hypothetical protein n=1 Tax=Paenarthrobacter ureafaciens TaxID=37931 RepID=UPI003F495CE8